MAACCVDKEGKLGIDADGERSRERPLVVVVVRGVAVKTNLAGCCTSLFCENVVDAVLNRIHAERLICGIGEGICNNYINSNAHF